LEENPEGKATVGAIERGRLPLIRRYKKQREGESGHRKKTAKIARHPSKKLLLGVKRRLRKP